MLWWTWTMEIQSPETTCLRCWPRYDRSSSTSCSRTPTALWASVHGASWWCCRAWSITRAPSDGSADIFTTLSVSVLQSRRQPSWPHTTLLFDCFTCAPQLIGSLRTTIGSCSPDLELRYIGGFGLHLPILRSLLSSYFWFHFSAHVKNPQFVCGRTWNTWVQEADIFIVRSKPWDRVIMVFFFFLSFILDKESRTRAWENETKTRTLQVSAERMVFWLLCFIPLCFFWWSAIKFCRHGDIIITSWTLALLVCDKACI